MATIKKISKTSGKKGKKGGVSILTPETVGAMTGAAIGGIAGMMLGSKAARQKFAVARDKALGAATDIMNNIEIDTKDSDKTMARGQTVRKSISKKTKSKS